MNDFVKLFERNGYTVENFNSEDSFIADNGMLCIPFTVRHDGLASAISFLSCDKEDIKKAYKNSEHIGYDIFSDWMNNRLKFCRYGRVGNHDHSTYEIECAIKQVFDLFLREEVYYGLYRSSNR